MSLAVQAAPPAHFPWLLDRLGHPPTPSFKAIEAVDSSGRIRGMVGYDSWTENSCQVLIALDAPVAWRALCRPAFSYPFEEAGKGVLLTTIRSDNLASVKFTLHLGFRVACRVRDGWTKGVDLILTEMRKENCRWLRPASAEVCAHG